jgi:hypothetical protein
MNADLNSIWVVPQPPLPFKRFNVPARHVEWLALANAGNYFEKKGWFYPFKTRFLRSHALPDGFDLQIITLKCWCGDGIYRGYDDCRPQDLWERCNRCNGTGIYLKKRIPLIRWMLGNRLFHEPSTLVADSGGMKYKEIFNGLIKHSEIPERTARRAMERLFLRYEPGKFMICGWRDSGDGEIRMCATLNVACPE